MKSLSREERLKWFNRARFGMFIHWGLYSLLERGEWVMFNERIPKEEYAELADRFKPGAFEPDLWAVLAKEAGMKYMIFTTRHHEGFCLYDSKVSDFTSVKTAAKKDFVAGYVRACRKAGLKVGLYYSLLDWRFPGYFNMKKYPESFAAMVEQVHGQVRELMSGYGKIDYLFYDGEWIPGVPMARVMEEGKGESPEISRLWRAKELNRMVRKLQPGIIINNRSGLDEDVDTPEQAVIPSQGSRSWESCMTMGAISGWGYVKNNSGFKTTSRLIQYLATAAAGGGNYVLNIGPKPDGGVRKEEITRLKEIGVWMKANGESVYGSERLGTGQFAGWRCVHLGVASAKGATAYLHVFNWPGETACLAGVKNKVLSATILSTGQKVKVEQAGTGRVFLKGLPLNPPDRHDTVIVLKLDGRPEAIDYEGIPL